MENPFDPFKPDLEEFASKVAGEIHWAPASLPQNFVSVTWRKEKIAYDVGVFISQRLDTFHIVASASTDRKGERFSRLSSMSNLPVQDGLKGPLHRAKERVEAFREDTFLPWERVKGFDGPTTKAE